MGGAQWWCDGGGDSRGGARGDRDEQRSAGANPRSTIATTTEIYDYLRVLFSAVGQPHDPRTGQPIHRHTSQQIVDQILAYAPETKIILLAPLVQNETGELTIGDSHEYGLVFDPFDKQFINQLITGYLKKFAVFKDWKMIQSWHGIYPKRTNGETEFIYEPQQGVKIINGIGGAGMTLSFGLAEEVMNAD